MPLDAEPDPLGNRVPDALDFLGPTGLDSTPDLSPPVPCPYCVRGWTAPDGKLRLAGKVNSLTSFLCQAWHELDEAEDGR
jgi:hypothetical protein